jgi:MFS family permease
MVLMIGGLLASAAFAPFAVSGNVVVLYVAAALPGIGYDISDAPAGVAVRETFGERDSSKKLGTRVGFLFLGASLAPIVLTAFYDAMGSCSMAHLVMSIVAAAAIVLYFSAMRCAMSRKG